MRLLNCETLTKQRQRQSRCCWLCYWRHASKAETHLAPAPAIIQVSYEEKEHVFYLQSIIHVYCLFTIFLLFENHKS